MGKRTACYALSALIVLWFLCLPTVLSVAQPSGTRVRVHYIDVGQADAILITDDAKTCTILIDSGDTRYPESSKNFKEYLSAQLPAGDAIDLVIASHPHNDHIGNMKWVLDTYQVKTYIDNGQPYTSQLYATLMHTVKQQQQHHLAYHTYGHVPSGVEEVCGPSGPKLSFLYPQEGFDPDLCAENANNCSVVAKLTVGETSFLFPGDAEDDEEALLLADPLVKSQLQATVLKVPHHGSDTSSSEDFLDAVEPSWMVISDGKKDVGTNKGYKHPRVSTVQELRTFAGRRHGARKIDAYDTTARSWLKITIWGSLYETAKDGTVILTTDGTTIAKETPM